MDTKNVIAAISLSAAVIIIYALFFGPNSSIIFSKLVQKSSSVRSNPGSISDLRNASSSFETDNVPFLVYLSVTFF